MDSDGSPSSKRSRKESPKNPPQVSQPQPPSQFHQQGPLQPQPPRGPVITTTYTSSRPVVQRLQSQSSAFRRYQPQTSAATSSSLFTLAPKNSSEPSRGFISQSLMIPDLSLTLNPQGSSSSSSGDFINPQVQRHTGQISTSSSTQSSSSSSTLPPKETVHASRGLMIPQAPRPSATMRARTSNVTTFDPFYQQGRQLQANMERYYRQLSQYEMDLHRSHLQLNQRPADMDQDYRQIRQNQVNLDQSYRQLHQNLAILDQYYRQIRLTQANIDQSYLQLRQKQENYEQAYYQHQLRQNRGTERSRFDNDRNLPSGDISQPGSSSMVKPSGPPQGSSSSSSSNSNPKD